MPEEEAFAVLVKLMQDYNMRELFKPSMAELGVCMYQLEYLIQVINQSTFRGPQSYFAHKKMGFKKNENKNRGYEKLVFCNVKILNGNPTSFWAWQNVKG